jgi:hypothetical protein
MWSMPTLNNWLQIYILRQIDNIMNALHFESCSQNGLLKCNQCSHESEPTSPLPVQPLWLSGVTLLKRSTTSLLSWSVHFVRTNPINGATSEETPSCVHPTPSPNLLHVLFARIRRSTGSPQIFAPAMFAFAGPIKSGYTLRPTLSPITIPIFGDLHCHLEIWMGETSSQRSRPGHKTRSSGYDESVRREGLIEGTRSVLSIIAFAVSVSCRISFAMLPPPI